ncbi:MAG TPA: hypothetical protein VJK51_00850 [Candidatus Nanoarchaeia archaeon]|nr:hypothetical protein [Candidatus Nanoarchaeia archaeon]
MKHKTKRKVTKKAKHPKKGGRSPSKKDKSSKVRKLMRLAKSGSKKRKRKR